jgi:hypothetical protein
LSLSFEFSRQLQLEAHTSKVEGWQADASGACIRRLGQKRCLQQLCAFECALLLILERARLERQRGRFEAWRRVEGVMLKFMRGNAGMETRLCKCLNAACKKKGEPATVCADAALRRERITVAATILEKG